MVLIVISDLVAVMGVSKGESSENVFNGGLEVNCKVFSCSSSKCGGID